MSNGIDGNRGEASVVRDAFDDASPSVPDTPEIAAAVERAAQLRAAHLAAVEADQPTNERIEAFRAKTAASDELDLLKVGIQANTERAEEARAKAAELEAKAVEAEAAGRSREAAEYREDAAQDLALARASDARVEQFRAEADEVQQRVDELDQQVQNLEGREAAVEAELDAAERAIDGLEEQVDLMREANNQQALAAAFSDEAARLRQEGRIEDAEAREALATQALAAASTAQSQVQATVVDEQALSVLEQLSTRVDDLVDVRAPDISVSPGVEPDGGDDDLDNDGEFAPDIVGDDSTSGPGPLPDDDADVDTDLFRESDFEPVEVEFDTSTGDGDGYEPLPDVVPIEDVQRINDFAPVDDDVSVDDIGVDDADIA
jgi:hypothetical protein